MKNAYQFDTMIGEIVIMEDDTGITDVILVSENSLEESEYRRELTEGLLEASKQLKEYFNGQRKSFTLSLNPKGTEFQKRVWNALLDIPYGETRSYKDIATILGNDKASRAVGMANHNNPIMCIIPCHRVIGSRGALVGYAGGIDIKQKLLELEQRGLKL